jgi:hypothetical protein
MQINLAAYLNAQRSNSTPRDDNNAEEYDDETIARGKLVDLFFEATLDEDPATFMIHVMDLDAYVGQYRRFCEHEAMSIFMRPVP